MTQRSLQEELGGFKPGDKVRVLYARRGRVGEMEIELGLKAVPSFRITAREDAAPAQKARLDAWMK